MKMDLSGFQLIGDSVTDMDMSNQQNNIDLISFYTPSFMSQNDSSFEQQDDILTTPLMSPVMTPSFTHQHQIQHTPAPSLSLSNPNEFHLTSPAMLPQKNHQIRYVQFEQTIHKKLSEISYQSDNIYQGKTAGQQQQQWVNSNSLIQSPYIKPATPASLMNMKPRRPSKLQSAFNNKQLFQSPVVASLLPPTRKPRGKKQTKRGSFNTSLVSPRTLKPLLLSPPFLSQNAEQILATRSNYQNVMEGKAAALGIAFTTEIKSGLDTRRTAHKAAEQKRRDSLKDWFEKLRLQVEEGYVKRQTSVIETPKENTDNDRSIKPLSKVVLLQYAYEYITSLKHTLDKKDAEIEKIISKKRKT